MKSTKKLLAVLLALVMAFGILLPVSASAAKSYKLTISADPAKEGDVSFDGRYWDSSDWKNVKPGTKVTVYARIPYGWGEGTGYEFEGWYAGKELKSSDMTYSFTMPEENYKLVARFKDRQGNYVLSVSSANPAYGTVSGTVTKQGESTTFTGDHFQNNLFWDSKFSVSVTMLDENRTFLGWADENGDIVLTSMNYSGAIRKDTYLTATFDQPAVPVTYEVSTSADPEAGGTVTPGGTVEAGKSFTVKATANPGYSFNGWYESGTNVSMNEEYAIPSVTGDMTLTARFTKLWKVTLDMNGGTFFGKETVSMDFEDGHAEEIPSVDAMNGWIEAGTWLTAPANSNYIGAEIDGVFYQPGKEYKIKKDVTIKVLWKSTEPTEITYSANDITYTKESKLDQVITAHGSENDDETYVKFEKLYIGGVEVNPTNYEASAGSLILTLKGEYLETLALDEYDVLLSFTDGVAKAKLSVVAASVQPTETPTEPTETPTEPTETPTEPTETPTEPTETPTEPTETPTEPTETPTEPTETPTKPTETPTEPTETPTEPTETPTEPTETPTKPTKTPKPVDKPGTPKTGDEARPMLYVAIMLLSAYGAALCYTEIKRNKLRRETR